MIRDILQKFNIDSFAFIPAVLCRAGNQRLYSSVEGMKNVIFMLFPYYCGDCGGRISAYGAVQDYHFFARQVFEELCNYIEISYPGKKAAGFADHSPYLECEGAALAGLGVIGENSLLISEKYSSYVFIGELVTDLCAEELISEGVSEGAGVLSRCEGCDACLRACPSGALLRGERETCISALTQKKGELSEDEAALIKRCGSIWGCDVCQSVCPHTKKAFSDGTVYSPIPYFKDSLIKGDPADAILQMDEAEFARYPFAWRKKATVVRNIAVIRGDCND